MVKNYYDLKFNLFIVWASVNRFNLFIVWASVNRITEKYYDLKFN